MSTLVGILSRDRPEGLIACLAGIERAGAPVRVVIHLDEPEPEVREIAASSGHQVLTSETRIGIGASLNRILALRSPEENFCRIDGDTEIETPRWLWLMTAQLGKWVTLSTVLRLWEGTYSRSGPYRRGLGPGERVTGLRMGRGMGSVMLAPADVCERLGGFRDVMPYAFEDSDWYARLRLAYGGRRRAGTDLRIVAREAAPRSRKLWRQTGVRMDDEYAEARAAFFAEEHPIHRPLPVMA